MRRAIGLLLAAVMFLSVLGYYGIFIGLRYMNSVAVVDQLNSDNYNIDQAITIKVPISLPYAIGPRSYQRVNGEFTYNNEVYRLVKQKYQHDTLYVVCIKDTQATFINGSLTRYVKTFTDKPTAKSSTKNHLSFVNEYILSKITLRTQAQGWLSGVLSTGHFTPPTSVGGQPIPTPPPEG